MDAKKKMFHKFPWKLYILYEDSEPKGVVKGVDEVSSETSIQPGDKDGVVDDKELFDLLVHQRDSYRNSTLVLIWPRASQKRVGSSGIVLRHIHRTTKIYPLIEHNIDVTAKQPIDVKP